MNTLWRNILKFTYIVVIETASDWENGPISISKGKSRGV